MSEIPSEPCKRCRITCQGENYYLTISERAILSHFPAEGGIEGKDMKALLNFCCRLMSKLVVGQPMTWEDIAERAVRSGVGHKCITDEIAKAIRETQCNVK